VVEGHVEDPHRVHVLLRRQMLTPEDQDLVAPERLPQRLRGGLVHGPGEVDAIDFGGDQGAGRSYLETAGQGLGHVILLEQIR
jgi:hypothetical protein